jgi:hypothetical protein
MHTATKTFTRLTQEGDEIKMEKTWRIIALLAAVATALVLAASPASARECISVKDGNGDWGEVCNGSRSWPL